MTREEDVDREMLKGFYFAYKDGTSPPATVKELKGITVTGEEFIDSERRLMQAKLLDGKKERVTAGTLYFPTEISDLGIQTYENHNVDPLFRGMVSVDLGFSGKKYRFQKWFRKNWKWCVSAIVIPIIIAIVL